jgi:hypothetical protein
MYSTGHSKALYFQIVVETNYTGPEELETVNEGLLRHFKIHLKNCLYTCVCEKTVLLIHIFSTLGFMQRAINQRT